MAKTKYEIGMVGLGVMGRNLVLNIADHGYSVSGYDKDLSKVQELQTDAGSRAIDAAQSLERFVSGLSTPRVIMMLVPAGQVVDNVIRELLPQLEKGDLIIDAGNSHFKDTDLRSKALAEKGILYICSFR
jgi:6-phosphogluconate dehydrogenase